jgi:hypothetical protein
MAKYGKKAQSKVKRAGGKVPRKRKGGKKR